MSTDAELSEIEYSKSILSASNTELFVKNDELSDSISVKSYKSFIFGTVSSSTSEKSEHKLNVSDELILDSKELHIEQEIRSRKHEDSISTKLTLYNESESVTTKDHIEQDIKADTELSVKELVQKDTPSNYSENFQLESSSTDKIEKRSDRQTKYSEAFLRNLSAGYAELFQEEYITELWEAMVCEHFYMIGNKRALKEDVVERIYDLKKKYEAIVENTCDNLCDASVLKDNLEKQEQTLDIEVKDLKSKIEANEMKLKKKMYTVGMKAKSYDTVWYGQLLSKKDVKNKIMKMSLYRKQFTNLRFDLYKIQNKVMELSMKLETLDDLGNGLRMTHFEKLKNATNNLQNSVEEKQEELDTIRSYYNRRIYKLAFRREKLYFNKKRIVIEQQELKDMEQDKQCRRQSLIDLKFYRRSLRDKFRQRKAKYALEKNPPLVRDYVKATAEVENLRNTNNQYENEIDEITNEHENVRAEIAQNKLNRSDSKLFDKKLQEDLRNMDQPFIQPWIKRGIKPVMR